MIRTTRIVLGLVFALALSPSAAAQATSQTLPGYARRVSGETLPYHAPDPGVTHGLLVRSLHADRPIEWETSPVPADFAGEYAEFVWLFGLQVSPEQRRFELRLNGERCLAFGNPPTGEVRDWTIEGVGGVSLRFRATMIDRFGDLMGYAVLRVPAARLRPAEPLRLAVAGESAGSRAWYITFMSEVREGVRASSRAGVVRDPAGNYQPIEMWVTYLGEPTDAVVRTSFGVGEPRRLELGGNRFDLRHPEVTRPTDAQIALDIGGREAYRLTQRVDPVRHWTIDLVQHTHTDVGYTRPQTEILPEHLRFIDTALDLCDQTDSLPDAARFRWTCEASWAVREYLESRTPEQIARLRRRVDEGRIEVTGMFLNMSEVIDEPSYAWFLRPVRTMREHSLTVTTAMQNDINGAAWCLADYFSDIGIEYLSMGQHTHRALEPFDIATPFWWESPAGNRVLAFRADHYMIGNFWGIHTGSVEACEDGLLRYLAHMEQAGYPFDRVAAQHSGYPTDNSPPSLGASRFVEAWNEKYEWPRVRNAIARDYLEWVRAEHADELPVVRQAWTDWWTDGFGSAARESAAARETQSQLVAVEGLLAMEKLLGLATPDPLGAEIEDIRDDLLFYAEHTFGSAESIREPLNENSMVQWAEKSAYAWDAVKRSATLAEGAMARLTALVPASDTPTLLVVNTLNFGRSGLLEIYVDHELFPIDRVFRVVDEHGGAVPTQLLRSRPEGSYWAISVPTIPAYGWRTFRVEVGPEPGIAAPAGATPGRVLENQHYRIELDSNSGAVASLIEKPTGRELVDAGAPWGFGQVVYETLGNREQLEGYTLDDFTRRSLGSVLIENITPGPVWDTIGVRGELPFCQGPGGVRMEVRLFHAEPRVDLAYTIQKRTNFEPEGLYVAFPFGPPDGEILYETLGGIVRPNHDIVRGGASDWQTVQSFAAVRWPGHAAMLSSDEIPLVQLGEINLGKFMRETRIERPHIYGWVMNNYWTTNFKASQEGEFRWRYTLTTGGDGSRGAMTRFGWGARVPLLARMLAPVGGAQRPAARSVLPFEACGVILVASRPVEGGVVLHLREVEGQGATIPTDGWRPGGRPARIREVNVLNEPVGPLDGPISLGAFETKFVLLETD
ncbi:MAG: hypothetical protein IT431_10920 [Phycisphaerales bacterium]|nr:hypothetical protein [Phycisphaerales bacterium]